MVPVSGGTCPVFARMGLTAEAANYNTRKLDDSPRRFPTSGARP